MSIRSVAIVGAGISGLCAAKALTRGGMDVTIFEKARGVGGRTSTRREHEYTFDHGAQFFTAADNRFRDLVQEWESAGIVAQWKAPIVVLNEGSSVPASDTRQRFVGVPGMNAMTRHLAEELHVVPNTRIMRCERRDHLWHLFDEKDVLTGAFDTVIVTTPPEQATPLLADSPWLIAAVGTVKLPPCWALMVAFDRRLNIPFDGAYVENSSLSWIARNVGVCGDWCLAARVEGAAMSGIAAAERVLGCSVQPPLA